MKLTAGNSCPYRAARTLFTVSGSTKVARGTYLLVALLS
jgi:hypothetical protein